MARIRLAPLVWALLASGASCAPLESPIQEAYSEISREEDARGSLGLARILSGLEASSRFERVLAARALGRMEDPSHLAAIAPLLRDEAPVVRAVAAEALAQSVYREGPSDEAARLLSELIARDQDAETLAGAAVNIGRLRAESADERSTAASALVETARILGLASREPADFEEDPDSDLAAALGLARGLEAFARAGEAGLSEEAPALSDSLGNVARALYRKARDESRMDLSVRASRIRRLSTRALAGVWGMTDQEAAERIRDPDWGVRLLALQGLSPGHRSMEAAVARGFADEDPKVRTGAVDAYADWLVSDRSRGVPGCEPLLAAAKDASPHVSHAAIGALGRVPCDDEGARTRFLSETAGRLGGAPDAWRAPAYALAALAGVDGEAAASVLPAASEHPSPFARAWTAMAAGRIEEAQPRAAAAATARKLAGDASPNVRAAAIAALDALEGAGAMDLYRAQLESEDPWLVMTAARLVALRATSREPALFAALERFAQRSRETERDVRLALLDAFLALGPADPEALRPYLSSFDEVFARRVAEALGEAASPNPPVAPPAPSASRIRDLERRQVRLHMRGLGEVVIALRPDLALTNADRFARLAESGYFDGLVFHRVVPNFVVQGGSPGANEYSGDGPYSRDEISGQPHWRGTVGLSTRGRDTGDAQIFINLVDNNRLDFNYTIYGTVTEGMEVVDRVLEGSVIDSARVELR